MGGTVCVAIRRSNGDEFVYHRWTNPLPDYFIDPRFRYEDADFLKEFHDYGVTSSHGGLQTKIFPVNYGVILVDFITKSVFSRQGYCNFGDRGLLINEDGYTFFHDPEEDFEIFAQLAKRPSEVSLHAFKRDSLVEESIKERLLQAMAEAYENKTYRIPLEVMNTLSGYDPVRRVGGYFRALATAPLTVDHHDDLSREEFSRMRKWIKEREWKTPIVPIKEVAKGMCWE